MLATSLERRVRALGPRELTRMLYLAPSRAVGKNVGEEGQRREKHERFPNAEPPTPTKSKSKPMNRRLGSSIARLRQHAVQAGGR